MIRLALVAITLATLAFPLPLRAQGTETYAARLGWVPTTPTDRPNVTGKGSATATLAASGKLSGSIDLTAEQVEALKQGKLYVQLHTAKGVPPDGSTLWGWL